MKLINKEKRAYIAYNVVIQPDQVVDVEDTKALDILLKQPGVEEYIDKAEAKALEEENAKLKKELEAVKKETKKVAPKRAKKG